MKDLMVKVGEYEKNGETKGEWKKIGVMGENSSGPYLMLDPDINLAGVLIRQRLTNPEKDWKSVMVSVFDRKPQNYGNQTGATVNGTYTNQTQPSDDHAWDNDIPI